MSADLITNRDGYVVTLTMNRPDKRNALSADLIESLLVAIQTATRDGTRLVILKGEGKAFSAGFDFSGIERQTDGDLVLRFIRLEIPLQAIYHAPFATMALAHGACFGAAADIVCCCSRRIATPGTKFRMPGLRFGIALGTRRLAEVISADYARRILQTSTTFDADLALACGFLSEIVIAEEWPKHIADARVESLELPDAGSALLHHCDADLADLVASASVPGLKSRIEAFIAATRKDKT